jgi:hypothetical protein
VRCSRRQRAMPLTSPTWSPSRSGARTPSPSGSTLPGPGFEASGGDRAWTCFGGLPVNAETPAIREAFYAIDEHIRKAELKDLRQGVLSRGYFIISPINPMNPPGPEDMEKVAAALRTLDDLGLIITL